MLHEKQRELLYNERAKESQSREKAATRVYKILASESSCRMGNEKHADS